MVYGPPEKPGRSRGGFRRPRRPESCAPVPAQAGTSGSGKTEMNCSSEPGVIAAGAGALPGARRRCEAGKRTHGPGHAACLALLAATALLALAAPAQAQTEIWSATLTPQAADVGAIGCDSNDSDTADQCSNTSVLSDNNFTLDSTDHTICPSRLRRQPSQPLSLTTPPTSTPSSSCWAPPLSLSPTPLPSKAAGSSSGLTSLSWTVGTDVSVRLISLTAPGAPTGLAATANGPSQIDLAWTAPASTGGSAITGYKIEVSPDGTSWSDLVADTRAPPPPTPTWGSTPPPPATTSVSAINAVGTSDPSGTDDATTEANTVTAQTVFISNTEQPDGSVTTLSSNYFAQQFQTGSNVGGYTLSEIVVRPLPPLPSLPHSLSTGPRPTAVVVRYRAPRSSAWSAALQRQACRASRRTVLRHSAPRPSISLSSRGHQAVPIPFSSRRAAELSTPVSPPDGKFSLAS